METENQEILLDELHKALFSLDATSAQPSKSDCQRIAELTKKVCNLSSLLGQVRGHVRGNPGPSGPSEGIEKRRRGREDRMKRIKARSKYKACGEMGHWYKDPECPLYVKEAEDSGTAVQDVDGSPASPLPVSQRGGQ